MEVADMKVNVKGIPAKTLISRLKKEQINLEHRLQRKEGQWSTKTQSLLIDTLLRGYLINPVFTVVDNDKQFVIDGVQRLSTLRRFYNDEFRLSRDLDSVVVNGEEYKIAGKKYSKLDENLKDELDTAQIQVYEISDYTDKDIREMFSRLNSGKSLNSTQQFTPLYSDELGDIIANLSSLPFFEARLTPAQLKSSVDQSVVLETLMLCEVSKDYDFGSFSKKAKTTFIEYYNNNIDKNKINLITEGIVKLNSILPVDVKIPKTTLPFLCYSSYRVVKDKKGYDKFAKKVNEFLEGYDSNEDYKASLSNGTSSAESVKARFDYWRKIIHSLQNERHK